MLITRISHCLDSRLRDPGEFVSPTRRPRSSLKKRYFLLLIQIYVRGLVNCRATLYLVQKELALPETSWYELVTSSIIIILAHRQTNCDISVYWWSPTLMSPDASTLFQLKNNFLWDIYLFITNFNLAYVRWQCCINNEQYVSNNT
jgi:hypothetical protein